MPDEDLKGIGVGSSSDGGSYSGNTASDLIDRVRRADLSELDDAEIDELFDVLRDKEELEGISVERERGERGQVRRSTDVRAEPRRQQQQVFEAQLSELEQIDDNTELLQNIAAGINTTNNLLEDVEGLLVDLIEVSGRDPALAPKDANTISFSRARSPRDVIDENDISTSIVLVKTNPQNDGDLYVGQEGVQPNNGYRLEPGERQIFQVDILVEEFQIVSEESGDNYSYIAFGVL